MEAGAVAQVVGEGIRLAAHRDTHARRDAKVGIEPHLGVQQEFVAGDGGVGRREGGNDAPDGVHDPLAEVVRLGIAAVDLPPVRHQYVDALGQAGHAEHGQEAVAGEQALLHEEGKKPDCSTRKRMRSFM